MNVLLIPYIVNIILLVPVSLGTLFNVKKAVRPVFEESAGYRTLSGAVWTAILILSVIGLFYPVKFSPVLVVQVAYKLLWLVVFFLPRIVDKTRHQEIDRPITIIFLVLLLAYPFFIPWSYLFS
jgi:hypothetical protein